MQISGYGDDAIVTVPETRADGKAVLYSGTPSVSYASLYAAVLRFTRQFIDISFLIGLNI